MWPLFSSLGCTPPLTQLLASTRMIKLTTERLLVAAALLLVLACAAPRQCAGLPWEEAQRVLYEQQRRRGGNGAATVSKRDFILDFPVCPNHPRAVPQAFINQRVRLVPSGNWEVTTQTAVHCSNC